MHQHEKSPSLADEVWELIVEANYYLWRLGEIVETADCGGDARWLAQGAAEWRVRAMRHLARLGGLIERRDAELKKGS